MSEPTLKERLEIYRTGQEQIPFMKKGALEIFLGWTVTDAYIFFRERGQGVGRQSIRKWRCEEYLPVEKAALIIENLEEKKDG